MDKNLAGALLKAQGAMGKLLKDSINPAFKSKYASLAAVLDTVHDPLFDAGLVLYQSATAADGMVIVRSALIHAETGESIEEMLPLPVTQQTPQAYGSAITYGRRYLAMAMCGLAPDDDDGEASSKDTRATAQEAQVGHRNGATMKHTAPITKAPQRNAQQATVAPRPNPVPDDVDFGQGGEEFDDIPDAAQSDAAVKAGAHSLLHSDVKLTAIASELIVKCHELDKSSGDKALSIVNKDNTGSGQYGLLAGKIDRLTKKDAHGPILSALVGSPVNKETSVGWKLKELIEWMQDDNPKKAKTENAIRDVWTALQEMGVKA